MSRTTGQGDGRNESRTQVPHSQLYRIPVLFHKVTAPHLSPRVGRMVIRLRIEAELLKIHNHIKERKVQGGPSCPVSHLEARSFPHTGAPQSC